MDPPSSFRFPAKEGPVERVNGTRDISSVTTSTRTTSRESNRTVEVASEYYYASPQASPTRKAKAPLFGEPTTPSKVSGFALPQSPSLPEINALRSHVRTNSDVQGLVKRFEHLDVRDRDAESVERKRRHEAELRRAQIAREEAESDVRRLREEVRRLKNEGEDGRERERKVAKRLEVVMEEFGASKESRESQHTVYEKELRKARKEAFKSSSTVLKLQEELKSTRATLRVTQSGLDLEKQKVQRKEQERFEMEYRQIPLQEELTNIKQKLRVSEEEREALKTTLKEEEVARIAAEGMIALPISQDMDLDLLSSPRKQASPLKNLVLIDPDENKENMGTSPRKAGVESKRLAEELEREKRRREHTEEMLDFLRVECMFRCCGCKTAARVGHELTLELDNELAAGVEKIRAGMDGILSALQSPDDVMELELDGAAHLKAAEVGVEVTEVSLETEQEPTITEEVATEDILEPTMTMTAESPVQVRSPEDQLREEEEQASSTPSHPQSVEEVAMLSTTETGISAPARPQTPPLLHQHHQSTPFRQQPSIRTVTTTTTVPMHFTPAAKAYPPVFDPEDVENVPPTPRSAVLPDGSELPVFDRAAALAAIEYRRGRAKSIANGQATPRKQMMEGIKDRRDISAPALGQAVKGTMSAKRTR